MKPLTLILHLSLILTLFSCTEDNTNVELDFSQKEMLENYSTNIIKPSINLYQLKVNTLNENIKKFVETPSNETLTASQTAFKEAYLAWASVNAFQFGPAIETAFLAGSNTFPTNYTKLEENIASENLNLGAVTAKSVKGLPSIDYLLFIDENTVIVDAFLSNKFRGQYLVAVAEDLLSSANYVNDAWNDEYAEVFASNEGNDPSSSLSYLVNEYNKSFERCKNQRVGYALGKNSLSGKASPRSVEAYYSEYTLTLLKQNILSLENIFKGNDGKGLDDYLTAYYNAGSIQEDLSSKILSQFAVIKDKIENCNDPFATHIENQDQQAEELYSEMAKLVVMIKSEMPSALSVKITYQDSDGD